MLVISNSYFMLIKCCLKKQNNLFCIIICYFELKLKCLNIVFVYKQEKAYLKG